MELVASINLQSKMQTRAISRPRQAATFQQADEQSSAAIPHTMIIERIWTYVDTVIVLLHGSANGSYSCHGRATGGGIAGKDLNRFGDGAHDSTDPGGGGSRCSSKRDHAMNQKTKQKQKSREAIAASGRRTPS